jgi:hypothetical protein
VLPPRQDVGPHPHILPLVGQPLAPRRENVFDLRNGL